MGIAGTRVKSVKFPDDPVVLRELFAGYTNYLNDHNLEFAPFLLTVLGASKDTACWIPDYPEDDQELPTFFAYMGSTFPGRTTALGPLLTLYLLGPATVDMPDGTLSLYCLHVATKHQTFQQGFWPPDVRTQVD